MAEEFQVKLETPWLEPQDLAEPTAEQWTGGVVVQMIASVNGLERNMLSREYWLLDAGQAERFVAAEYARYVTEREIKCAAAVGQKWPGKPGVKAPAPAKGKAKGKAKAEDTPEEG